MSVNSKTLNSIFCKKAYVDLRVNRIFFSKVISQFYSNLKLLSSK